MNKNSRLFLLLLSGSLFLSGLQILIPGIKSPLSATGTGLMSAFVGDQGHEQSPFTEYNEEVKKAVKLFTGDGREFFSRALKNSTAFLPKVRRIFRNHGVPDALAYLALIESGYNNNAYSRAAAVGMWQFMAATGRGYGLRVNWLLDERRDFVKASSAAARHLKDLYKRFGDWHLALAAYNAGAGYIGMRMRQTGARDYWQLAPHLYNETKLYVPRFLAAVRIARNPEVFGFDRIAFRNPLCFRRVVVKKRSSLGALAVRYKVDGAAIRKVNPHLTRGIIPASSAGVGVNIPVVDRTSWRPLATVAAFFKPAPDNEG